jgi:hypothetical protein
MIFTEAFDKFLYCSKVNIPIAVSIGEVLDKGV